MRSRMRLHVVTSGDEPSFAATLATINSVLQFHPDALIRVVCSEAAPPTPVQRRLFAASDQVRIGRALWQHAPTGTDKARACRDFGDDAHVVAWIDRGCVLCSPVVDVAGRRSDGAHRRRATASGNRTRALG
jgi:hypothetical protein